MRISVWSSDVCSSDLKCPNTPKGTQVGPDGCELDSDADGVPEVRDRCPNTPKGVQVDDTGCTLHIDGGGMPDHPGRFPATPQVHQGNADAGLTKPPDADGAPRTGRGPSREDSR